MKLFYVDKQDNKIKSTTKVLDSVELVDNPYKRIVELLIEDKSDSKLIFPDNTRVYDANIDKKIVTVNFSKEILNYKSEEEKNNITNILANTLFELTEVNAVKIKVEGQDNYQYKDTYVKK
ncbi:Sporulation and spore germination [compost metagenome]